MSYKDANDTIEKKCGLAATIDLLGGQYKLLILRALLLEDGPMRFGELRRALSDISQKTLTRNLRDLEASGVITRTVFAEVPPRVEYELTKAGCDLMPVFQSMRAWGEAHLEL